MATEERREGHSSLGICEGAWPGNPRHHRERIEQLEGLLAARDAEVARLTERLEEEKDRWMRADDRARGAACEVARLQGEVEWLAMENAEALTRQRRALDGELNQTLADRDLARRVAHEIAGERDALRTRLAVVEAEIDKPGGWREMVRVANAKAGELEQRLAVVEAERDVWSGAACRAEQAAGNGPCGACRDCWPKRLAVVEGERDAQRETLRQFYGSFAGHVYVKNEEWSQKCDDSRRLALTTTHGRALVGALKAAVKSWQHDPVPSGCRLCAIQRPLKTVLTALPAWGEET